MACRAVAVGCGCGVMNPSRIPEALDFLESCCWRPVRAWAAWRTFEDSPTQANYDAAAFAVNSVLLAFAEVCEYDVRRHVERGGNRADGVSLSLIRRGEQAKSFLVKPGRPMRVAS